MQAGAPGGEPRGRSEKVGGWVTQAAAGTCGYGATERPVLIVSQNTAGG